MIAQLIWVLDGEQRYQGLMFWCPGCEAADGGGGLHLLPIAGDTGGKPRWDFDGNLEAPTLTPSILTRISRDPELVCHSFLREGVFQFLNDCSHKLAGQHVPMPELPEWAV